jgi:hypothetical protein
VREAASTAAMLPTAVRLRQLLLLSEFYLYFCRFFLIELVKGNQAKYADLPLLLCFLVV